MLYFDNASTTYVYPEVAATIYNVIAKHWGNPMNLYSFGLESSKLVEEARTKIAKSINADPDEIIFTSCSSESNALAINQRLRCFCSPYEHHDIKENPRVTVVDEGHILKLKRTTDDGHWSALYSDYLYAHMLVNNETGEVFELKEYIKAAHDIGMLVLVDATQALGNIPIDVRQLDADFMSFSFHKVHAPKGIGALYIKKSLQDDIKPLIYGSQEFGYRGGTSNVPYIVGAGIAVEQALAEMDKKKAHTTQLRKQILEGITNNGIPYRVNQGVMNIPSILNIAFEGLTGDSLLLALDAEGVSVSTGSACNSGDLKPSEVLTAMNVSDSFIQGAIRISMSLENSVEDAEILVKKITKCYKDLKG